jgi:hypothetical protein
MALVLALRHVKDLVLGILDLHAHGVAHLDARSLNAVVTFAGRGQMIDFDNCGPLEASGGFRRDFTALVSMLLQQMRFMIGAELFDEEGVLIDPRPTPSAAQVQYGVLLFLLSRANSATLHSAKFRALLETNNDDDFSTMASAILASAREAGDQMIPERSESQASPLGPVAEAPEQGSVQREIGKVSQADGGDEFPESASGVPARDVERGSKGGSSGVEASSVGPFEEEDEEEEEFSAGAKLAEQWLLPDHVAWRRVALSPDGDVSVSEVEGWELVEVSEDWTALKVVVRGGGPRVVPLAVLLGLIDSEDGQEAVRRLMRNVPDWALALVWPRRAALLQEMGQGTELPGEAERVLRLLLLLCPPALRLLLKSQGGREEVAADPVSFEALQTGGGDAGDFVLNLAQDSVDRLVAALEVGLGRVPP